MKNLSTDLLLFYFFCFSMEIQLKNNWHSIFDGATLCFMFWYSRFLVANINNMNVESTWFVDNKTKHLTNRLEIVEEDIRLLYFFIRCVFNRVMGSISLNLFFFSSVHWLVISGENQKVLLRRYCTVWHFGLCFVHRNRKFVRGRKKIQYD